MLRAERRGGASGYVLLCDCGSERWVGTNNLSPSKCVQACRNCSAKGHSGPEVERDQEIARDAYLAGARAGAGGPYYLATLADLECGRCGSQAPAGERCCQGLSDAAVVELELRRRFRAGVYKAPRELPEPRELARQFFSGKAPGPDSFAPSTYACGLALEAVRAKPEGGRP